MSSPPPLVEALDEVAAGVESAPHLLILLDFDGTLAPIAENPWLARMPTSTRSTLETLARHPDCTVGVISGRALEDVRAQVGIDGLVYAGNHGLDIRGAGLQFDEMTAIGLKGEIEVAVAEMKALLGRMDGVLVEPKGVTASVHFRRVPVKDWNEVERGVRQVIPDNHPDLIVVGGKMVWEVRPRVAWNKGMAVRWIREQLGLGEAMTLYLGDDRTDEDAFEEVGRFVTARVGPPQATRAGYQIADTAEVAAFLLWLSLTVRLQDLSEASFEQPERCRPMAGEPG